MRLKLLAACVLVGLSCVSLQAQRFVRGFTNVQEMISVNPNDIHRTADLRGYRTVGDGGGGQFSYDSASAAQTNLGTCFKPTAFNGRWIRQFSGPVNVLWFGARRDRVNGEEPFSGFTGTDSSTNFQNAIDFINTSTNLYGVLHVPAGRYTWTNAVYLNGSVILSGEGKANATVGEGGGSQILVKGLGITGLVVGVGKSSHDWVVRDLAFDGFTNNAAFGIQVGGATNESSRGTISRISTRKFSGSGLRVVSCNTMLIEGCDFATSAAGSAALLFDYITGGSINAITTIQNHIAGSSINQTDGWRVQNGTQILSLGDVIEGAELGAGLFFLDTSANPGRITRNTFIATWFEQNGTNIVAYYPGLSRTMIDNRFLDTFFGRIMPPSTNQVAIGNGIFTFKDSAFGTGENQVFRGMTSGIVQWIQPATNGAWYLDSPAGGNISVVNYETHNGALNGFGTQNPLWALHVSNSVAPARLGLDTASVVGSVLRAGAAIAAATASDGIALVGGAGLGASLVPNNGGSWGLTVTSTNISYGTASPNPNAVFDLVSPGNNKAFMPPRMTQVQRDAISAPTAGMVIYQNDGVKGIYYYDGVVWTNKPPFTSSLTAPRIVIAGASGSLTDTSELRWDSFLSGLIVSNSAGGDLFIIGTAPSFNLLDVGDEGSANRESVVINKNSTRGFIGTQQSAAGTLRPMQIGSGTSAAMEFDIANVSNFKQGVRVVRRATAIATAVTVADYYLACTAGGFTVTLPDASTVGAGFIYVIKDVSGGSGAANIILDPTGADTIDGGATYTINVNFRAVQLISDGANNYEIISVSP